MKPEVQCADETWQHRVTGFHECFRCNTKFCSTCAYPDSIDVVWEHPNLEYVELYQVFYYYENGINICRGCIRQIELFKPIKSCMEEFKVIEDALIEELIQKAAKTLKTIMLGPST